MNINEFSDLSNFILGEIEKIDETVEGFGATKKLTKCLNKQIIRYTKLYTKPLYNSEKRRIKVWEAIDTMPHGFFWKIFHAKLWRQVKTELESQGELYKYEKSKESNSNVENQTYYPVLVREGSVPVTYNDCENEE